METVQGATPYQRIVGFCHPIRDLNVVLPPDNIDSMISGGLIRDGVAFLATEPFKLTRDAIIRRFARSMTFGPGGPVSNTIYSMGSMMPEYPRDIELVWIGPFRSSHSLTEGDPLASLRRVGVRTQCLPTSISGPCESVCIIDQTSRDTRSILVGPRPLPASDILPVGRGDLLIVALRHLTYTWEHIDKNDTPDIAIVLADQMNISESERNALSHISGMKSLRFVVGRTSELIATGILRRDQSRGPLIQGAEVVGTASGAEVLVLPGDNGPPKSLPAGPGQPAEGSFLGAGDAYAGGYILARVRGWTAEDAHREALESVRLIAGTPSARAPGPESMSSLFGKFIDRQVADRDIALADRIRQTCGLTIITCGQTGVDQEALRAASDWGLASFALMPKGLRREGVDADADDPGLREYHKLELSSPSYRYCTWANVYSADGTLLIDYSHSEGSEETRRACHVLGRPLLEIVDTPRDRLAHTVSQWMREFGICVLHVGGNRAQNIPSGMLDDVRYRLDVAVRAAAAALEVPLPSIKSHARRLAAAHSGKAEYTRASLSQASDFAQVADFGDVKPVFRLGIPKLAEVANAVRRHLGSQPDGLQNEVQIFEGRSYDLVRMVDLGYISAALVGSDMIHEYGPGEYSVIEASGFFNCLVAEVMPPHATPSNEAVRPVIAQYPRLAEARDETGSAIIPVLGAAETWLRTDDFAYAVDTWRTGKTASEVNATLGRVYESCSLCLIAGTGQEGGLAAQAGASFMQWLGVA